MEYTVIIEKDPKTGTYTGQCVQLPAAISQGDTYEELMENIKDAIHLVLEYYREKAAAENRGRRVFYRKLVQLVTLAPSPLTSALPPSTEKIWTWCR